MVRDGHQQRQYAEVEEADQNGERGDRNKAPPNGCASQQRTGCGGRRNRCDQANQEKDSHVAKLACLYSQCSSEGEACESTDQDDACHERGHSRSAHGSNR